MKMDVLLKSWISCLFIITEGLILEHPDTELFQTNTVIEFVYYPQKIPWISARRVCQSIGGDFAKIDSPHVLAEIIRISLENYGSDIFSEEYWIGLVEIEEDRHYWVNDCSNLTYTSKYSLGYDGSKLCYRLKKDHTTEKRVCTSDEGYMCQRVSGATCNLITRFYGEVLSVGGNMSTCPERCSDDMRCWGTVEHVPDNCVLLALPGYGVKSLNLTSKTCYNVVLNTTTVTADLTNNTEIPDATCGSTAIAPTSSISTLTKVTSIGDPPCEPVSITQNVTLTMTSISTTTSTESVTTTSVSTSTSTTTSTESVTTTSVSTSTSTTTSTESVTTTSVSTSTSTTTSTESVTTTSTVTTTSVSVSPFTVTSTESVTSTSVSMSTFTVTSTVIQTATQNITIERAEEVAREIVKNLTIDAKSTSSHIRRLTSAEDSRKSAMFVGYIGIIVVVVPLGIMLIADVRKLFLDFRYHAHIYTNR